MGRAAKIYNRDIALFITEHGFDAAAERFDITPRRADVIITALEQAGATVPDALKEIASRARDSRLPTPKVGEEREYKSTGRGRTSVNTLAIGIPRGGRARVRYLRDEIRVRRPQKRGK